MMETKFNEIKVRDLAKGYTCNGSADNGTAVFAYDGKLNIRPKYQRSFVYKDVQRDAVMHTLTNDLPLNVMYWMDNCDGTYELMDGQQRTISILDYVAGLYSIKDRFFDNLTETEKNQILDYKLIIYFCKGNDKERLDWFMTINTVGDKLTPQEIRNATYAGPWLEDAKAKFSRVNGPAYMIAGRYLDGSANRQEYLETALSWISKGNIENYMAVHQNIANANELWLYFKKVIDWVDVTFGNVKYRREMKGIEWGPLYDAFNSTPLDPNLLEKSVAKLMADPDVTSKKGIYEYVLDGKESCLSIREFDDRMKREAYERQKGICPICHKHFEIEEMHADHWKPWSKGGTTTADNCRMLCRECNLTKSNH
jgi:hypothetical protein